MSTAALFDINTTAIERGVTLIAASAGTGKTYTIAGLFLRLLLEEELFCSQPRLSVREILVVTFTEAATEELRGRIRDLLVEAAEGFRTGKSAQPLVAALIQRYGNKRDEMRARLETALAGFDEAPIFTIHGFCQRVLKDRAFESGALFDAELITSQDHLLREITEDFWRRQFYEVEPIRVGFAIERGLSTENFHKLFREATRHPQLRLISRVDGQSLEELAAGLHAAFTRAREMWTLAREEICACFGSSATWANKPYNEEEFKENLAASLDQSFNGTPTAETLGIFAELTPDVLRDGAHKKRGGPPAHAFFELCARLVTSAEEWQMGLQVAFVAFARAELPRRKERLKVLSFDDLLTRVRDAVAGPRGAALVTELRRRYRAALIDEFQDTDPVQWEIFRRTFAHPDGLLFLIGDPKQAIYGFRGADVYTYLSAANQTTRRYTLGKNWRSAPALVRAVNAIFTGSEVERPFFEEAIDFIEMTASDRTAKQPLVIPDDSGAPLEFWFYPRDGEKEIAKGSAERNLPGVVASEIARLLNSDATLGGQPLHANNIAVLVDSNDQARLMQEALTARNVPSVLHTEASVFASDEARDLERLLAAVAQPGKERLVRAALVSDLLALGASELDGLSGEDEAAQARWQGWLEVFQRAHAQWRDCGFMPMFRQFVQEQHVRARLLACPDGERRLTNLLHLAEALHRASIERRLGPGALLKWFAEQRDPETQTTEEHQLRLERDDDAVRLVTIHKSKGLEYDIVFCPFVWRAARADSEVLFHGRDGVLTRDLGSGDMEQHRRRCIEERLAENLRLFYVALTRARHRCCVVWGAFNKAAISAPVWLFHKPSRAVDDVSVEMTAKLGQPDKVLRADLEAVVSRSRQGKDAPVVAVRDLPSATGERYQPAKAGGAKLKPRFFEGRIARDWRVASFSWLAARKADEHPDRDAIAPVRAETEAAGGIFAFPGGTRAGTCLHEIFEQVEFAPGRRVEIERVAEERLRAHGISREQFLEPVVQTVQRTLALPLGVEGKTFSLSEIKSSARLRELEFSFPIRKVSPAALRKVFARHSRSNALEAFAGGAGRLEFDPVRGFMKGFIDLVFERSGRFYLVDWKSNWLGNRVEDYHADAIGREMAAHHYYLQYHLYTVALDRYLRLRLPGYDYASNFGGVYYLFLRGIDPARPEYGVFHDRPDTALIHDLATTLLEDGK